MNIDDFLQQKRNEIEIQIAQLRANLDKIDIAESLFCKGAPNPKIEATPPLVAKTSSRFTIVAAMTNAFKNNPQGFTHTKLIKLLQKNAPLKINSNSVSRQLNKFKHEGFVKKYGNVWKLVETKAPNEPLKWQTTTKRGRIMIVIKNYPNGIIYPLIARQIEQQFGETVNRDSLKAELNAFRRNGYLKKEGGLWKIAQRDQVEHD